MFKRIFSAALIFGAAAMAPPIQAQVLRCLPRTTLIETLESRYAEQMIGGGLQSPSRLVEIWSSQTTGSFTVFVTKPDGMSCILTTGEAWNSAVGVVQGGTDG